MSITEAVVAVLPKRVHGVCLCALCAAAIPFPTLAQTPPPPLANPPKIDLEIFPSARRKPLDRGFDVVITVSNVVGEGIRSRGMMICYENQLASLIPSTRDRVGKDVAAAGTSPTIATRFPSGDYDLPPNCERVVPVQLAESNQEVSLRPGQQGHFRLRVPQQPIVKANGSPNWALLFMSRGEYAIDVFFKYETLEAPPARLGYVATAPADVTSPIKVTRQIRQTLHIELDPPAAAGYMGVLAGVLLIALFMVNREGEGVDELTTDPKGPRPPLKQVLRESFLSAGYAGVRVCRIVLVGVVTGIILVILLNQTDAPQLPISVSINDFWGGAFLGLVSLRFAAWVDAAILGRKGEKTEANSSTSAPAPKDDGTSTEKG